MIFELNEVLLEDEPRTVTMMASEGRMTCITGATPVRLTRWMHALMGFVPAKSGFISIDGEPLTPASAEVFRQLMAFAPARLEREGQVKTYDPPSVQDVFSLKANRDLPISNGILGEEMRRVAAGSSDPRVQLLAVAALLDRPILLVDNPLPEAVLYLKSKAVEGHIVIVSSCMSEIVGMADQIVEI